MPIMEWDDSLDIGVDAMNDEHKQILALMNKIFDADKAGQSGNGITALVGRLGSVTVAHFRDEEAYMEKIGFPGLGPHRLIHKDLLAKYGAHAEKVKAANGKVHPEFLSFLKRWLIAHIKGIDIKYGKMAVEMKKAG
jgi:hemerythrin